MGGKRWPKQWGERNQGYNQGGHGGSYGGGYGQPPWHVWQGAYSPRMSRPQFDKMILPSGSAISDSSSAQTEEPSHSALMREVQKSLSQARKADHKVRRLREDKKKKAAQWELFVKESKEAFLAEKRRFQTSIEKIEEDIRTATEAGKDSSSMVQALVLRGLDAKQSASAPMLEEDQAWEDLMKEAEAPTEPGFFSEALKAAERMRMPRQQPVHPDGRLMTQEAAARILQMAMASMPPEHMPTVVSTGPPPGLGGSAGPSAPPMTAPSGPAEPYMGSPSTRDAELLRATDRAAPSENIPSPSPPSSLKPSRQRIPVKGAPLQPVHTGTGQAASLAGKLEAKRDAMRPFGIPSETAFQATLNGQGFPDQHLDGGRFGCGPGACQYRSSTSRRPSAGYLMTGRLLQNEAPPVSKCRLTGAWHREQKFGCSAPLTAYPGGQDIETEWGFTYEAIVLSRYCTNCGQSLAVGIVQFFQGFSNGTVRGEVAVSSQRLLAWNLADCLSSLSTEGIATHTSTCKALGHSLLFESNRALDFGSELTGAVVICRPKEDSCGDSLVFCGATTAANLPINDLGKSLAVLIPVMIPGCLANEHEPNEEVQGLCSRPIYLPNPRARNTCIGRSGARALDLGTPSESTARFSTENALRGLKILVDQFQAFMVTLLGLVLAGLIKILAQASPGKNTPLARCIVSPVRAIPSGILLPLGAVGGFGYALNWSSTRQKGPKCNRKRQGRVHGSHQITGRNRFWPALCWLFFPAMPVQVWAAPPGAPDAVNSLRTLAQRFPEGLADNNIGPDPAIGSPIATSAVGFAPRGGPFLAAGVPECWPTPLSQPHFSAQTVDANIARRVAYPSVISGNGEDGRLLGVELYAPYYQTEIWAVQVPIDGNADILQRSVQTLLQDAFRGHLNQVAPLVPQRHTGSAQYVAYPSILDAEGGLGVAAVFDLGRVGGHIFAAIVARVLQDGDVLRFIRPLTRSTSDEFSIYIGTSQTPCAEGAHFALSHGTIITILASHATPSESRGVDDLFSPSAEWSQIQHVPRALYTPGVCLLYRNHRFLVQQEYHTGRTITQAIGVVLDKPDDSFITCSSFTFGDLDVQGTPCDRAIAVAELTPALRLPPGSIRRDIWIFCDYRPLGLKPKGHVTHVYVAHIPSLLAIDGVVIPEGHTLAVYGGEVLGDEVRLQDVTNLVFTCRENEVTEGSGWQPMDPPSDDDDPDDHDDEGDDPSREHDSVNPDTGPTTDTRAAENRTGEAPSRSRSPIGVRKDRADSPHTSCGVRIPTPPLEDTINSSCSVPVKQAGIIEAKQPERPGDAAHPVDEDAISRQSHLQQILLDADRRAGPEFPVDPEELMRRRCRTRSLSEDTVAEILFFVYVPLRTPEVLLLPLDTPCSIQYALQAVAESRDESLSQRFPELYVADPQPSREFASLLSLPAWAAGQVVVLIDSRGINGALFAAISSDRTNRESLCAIAHVPTGPEIAFYVQGLAWALGQWQQVDVAAGLTITFQVHGQASPKAAQARGNAARRCVLECPGTGACSPWSAPAAAHRRDACYLHD